MTKGVIYVAFGDEYLKLALNTIAYSRKYTALPITVVNNSKSFMVSSEKIDNVSFVYCGLPTMKNRMVKTSINTITPYDLTLYMDCDSVIHKKGIEEVFNLLGDADILLQRYSRWVEEKPYYNIYKNAVVKTECTLPLDVYIGGFFCFRKNERTATFFNTWNHFWELNGSGRDMPSLACAVQKCSMVKRVITMNEHKIFSFGIDKKCVAVHRKRFDDLFRYFGLPIHKQNKPFDKKINNDWKLVQF
jgi:hypothetical protein